MRSVLATTLLASLTVSFSLSVRNRLTLCMIRAPGTSAFDKNDEVVRITGEFVTTQFKLFVQGVEEDVGQKERERAALSEVIRYPK